MREQGRASRRPAGLLQSTHRAAAYRTAARGPVAHGAEAQRRDDPQGGGADRDCFAGPAVSQDDALPRPGLDNRNVPVWFRAHRMQLGSYEAHLDLQGPSEAVGSSEIISMEF